MPIRLPAGPAATIAGAMLMLPAACAPERKARDVRGGGLPAASVSATRAAAAYGAAIRQEFDASETLVLLADTSLLPRTDGAAHGGRLPDAVIGAMRATGIVRGTCAARRIQAGRSPECDAPMAGYVVRVSELFDAPGDTVRTFVSFERFGTAGATDPGITKPFSFENGYDLLPRGGGWRVVRKARRGRNGR